MNFWQTRTNLLLTIILLSVTPLLISQVVHLFSQPYLRFFPVAWILFAFYVYRVPRVGFAYSPNRRRIGVACMAAAVVTGLASGLFMSPNVAQLAALLGITGWLLLYFGIVPWTRLMAVVLFLWITWPLPGGLTTKFEGWLVQLAAKTASHILDLFEVPHFATSSHIDLRSTRIEIAEITGGLDAVPLLFFVALCMLFYTRRPMLLGALSLAAVPVIHWSAQTCYLLFQILWVEYTSDALWLSGWPLLGAQCVVILLEFLAVWLAIKGLSHLFDPVPVDSAEQARQGIHGFYNRFCLWPMNVVINVKEDEQSYFDENVGSKSRETIRKLPRFHLTEAAPDPWLNRRALLFCMATAGLTFLFAVLYWIVPAPSNSPPPQRLADEQLEALVSLDPTPDSSAQLVGASQQQRDALQSVTWQIAVEEGTGALSLEYPSVGLGRNWQVLVEQGYRQSRPARRVKVDTGTDGAWPLILVEFEDRIGQPLYFWGSAFDLNGNPYVPGGSLSSSLGRRLSDTIIGRILGHTTEEPYTFQTQFVLPAERVVSDRRKTELGTLFVEATNRLKSDIIDKGVSGPVTVEN